MNDHDLRLEDVDECRRTIDPWCRYLKIEEGQLIVARVGEGFLRERYDLIRKTLREVNEYLSGLSKEILLESRKYGVPDSVVLGWAIRISSGLPDPSPNDAGELEVGLNRDELASALEVLSAYQVFEGQGVRKLLESKRG